MEYGKTLRSLFVLSMAVWTGVAHADISSDMKDFYTSMGSNVTVEPTKIYKGQSATYGALGGFASRSPVRNFQPLTVSMPSVKAGCGGIDAYLGGFSFVNTDQFVQYIQAIGNNAVGFAFQLAMDVISPQLSDIMTKIRNTADWANQMNMNSCQAARNLVKGASAALGIRESYCTSEAVSTGKAADTSQAKFMCQDDTFFNTTLEDSWSRNRGKTSKSGVNEIYGNMVWDGLIKNGVVTGNVDFAEAAMSMVGTVVRSSPGSAADGSSGATQYYAPTLKLEEILTPNVNGTITVYTCPDKETCLFVDKAQIPGTTLRDTIRQRLLSIADKISGKDTSALTPDELGLINTTRVPIFGMMQYAADVSPTLAQSLVEEYSDYLVVYVLVRYFDAAVQAANDAIASTKQTGEDIDAFRRALIENTRTSTREAAKIMAKADQIIGGQMELINKFNFIRAQAYDKYAPDMQKRISFAKMLTKQNRSAIK